MRDLPTCAVAVVVAMVAVAAVATAAVVVAVTIGVATTGILIGNGAVFYRGPLLAPCSQLTPGCTLSVFSGGGGDDRGGRY